MTFKVLRLFSNTLTADDKYSLLNGGILTQHNQMNLSQKQKAFLQLFCPFLKCTLNFKHFQKKIALIAYVFRKVRTPKDEAK